MNMSFNSDQQRKLLDNPAWRAFTNDDAYGYAILGGCGLLLIVLTIWTYLGNPQTTRKRLFILVGLRLLALLVCMLTAIRPSVSVQDTPLAESTLVIALDASESMTVTDAGRERSRWQAMMQAYKEAEPILDQLRDEQKMTIDVYFFGDGFEPSRDRFSAERKPDGKLTDFRSMLSKLRKRYDGQKFFRGLIVVSDGGNNADGETSIGGEKMKAIEIAKDWSRIGPIHPFIVGQETTRTDKKDISIAKLNVTPSTVGVKAPVTVEAEVDAPGLEGSVVTVELYFDDELQPLKQNKFTLQQTKDNKIVLPDVRAPSKPGEVRVTFKIVDGPADEVSKENNQSQTYLTVTTEGLRILIIDKLREELRYLRRALATDKNFSIMQIIRQTDAPLPEAYDIKKDGIDVIILGDVSPTRLKGINPRIIEDIVELVRDKGVGLIMTGGIDSFGGSKVDGSEGWDKTPLEKIMPCELDGRAKQIDPMGGIGISPTPEGLSSYIMRLDGDNKKNKAIWDRLSDPQNPTVRLGGFTPIGRPKNAGVTSYARTGAGGPDILMGHEIGKARVLAFGADQTWKWVNLGNAEDGMDPDEGLKIHARFWKQTVLWLAKRENAASSLVVTPKYRGFTLGSDNEIRMTLKNKQGDPIEPSDIRYRIYGPGEKNDFDFETATKAPNGLANHRPKAPGEYTVVAVGKGKDGDGEPLDGMGTSRYIVYPLVSKELLSPAASPRFLKDIREAAGVSEDLLKSLETDLKVSRETAPPAEKLSEFLKKYLLEQPLRDTTQKERLHPDWRRSGSAWFLPLVVVIFVLILGVEWGLRRVWGLV